MRANRSEIGRHLTRRCTGPSIPGKDGCRWRTHWYCTRGCKRCLPAQKTCVSSRSGRLVRSARCYWRHRSSDKGFAEQPGDQYSATETNPLVGRHCYKSLFPQNLYRMSGGANNNERYEQVGHSWMKHTFFALEDTVCGACNTNNCETGTHLCPGCSDPYTADLNGDQNQIGSRAWVNPFTGSFPSNADDHSGHNHDGVSHRIRVEVNDLDTTLNQGATYFGEAAYISPHEYTWCQTHPGECNMYNNVSYRQFSVSGGPTN